MMQGTTMVRWWWLAALGGCALAMGCAEEDSFEGEGTLQVQVEIGGESLDQVSGALVRVDRCEGPRGQPWSVTAASLETRQQPHVLETEVHGRDSGGSTVVGETTIRLVSGCYRVEAMAISNRGEALEECAPLEASKVSVADGAMRELRLKGRCDGAASGGEREEEGGLRAEVKMNRAPVIEAVDYHPSRTVGCEDVVTMCVDARDPDGDPLSYAWKLEDGEPSVEEGASRAECLRVSAGANGNYMAQVVVRDLLFIDGQWMSVEAYLSEEMGSDETSRATLDIPFRVMGCEQ